MLGKLFDFMISVVMNGILCLFVAIPVCIVAQFALAFLSIPLSLIRAPIQGWLMGSGEFLASYGFIFSIMLISEVLDDYELPNFRKLFKKLWKPSKRRRQQCLA